MRVEVIAIMLAALFLAGPAVADDVEPAEEEPSMDLLEFLGSFETADGRWLDPTDLESSSSETDDEEGGEEK